MPENRNRVHRAIFSQRLNYHSLNELRVIISLSLFKPVFCRGLWDHQFASLAEQLFAPQTFFMQSVNSMDDAIRAILIPFLLHH